MSKEEIEKLRSDMHTGVRMMLDEVRKLGERGFPVSSMMAMSDILKDMSKVEKNLAEANYYDRKTS